MSPAQQPSPTPARLPLLAVRDLVLFPHMGVPLSVGRERSIRSVEAALASGRQIAVVTQKRAAVEDPGAEDLYRVGVLADIVKHMRTPEGTLRVWLTARRRLRVGALEAAEHGGWEAELDYPAEPAEATPKCLALMRENLQVYEQYLRLTRAQPEESAQALAQIQEPARLADAIASKAVTKISERQLLLEIFEPEKRLKRLAEILNAEIEIINLERKIHTRVRSQIQKTQKEYYLTEQMKAIQKELRQKDDFAKELDELRSKVAAARMPKPAAEAALKELSRLEKMMPYSPEATVCRSYLDWMIGLPWSKRTKDKLDIARAREILDGDHFGLEKAKERVLEYLAVCKLTKSLKGPILCFVGPPGVGKTSLGRSIAKAMNRNFTRVALGGVRDEAEIRGHRRTYIGSLPGRVIQSLRKAKSRNPVFLLDEIDKMGTDWRGDPAAALLEVLDPEQNHAFVDHYLDVEFDLSSILFVCTANTLEGIPSSLTDRLEVIRFSGYTQREKREIAKGYLIPKQRKLHGLKDAQLEVSDDALDRVIQEYTREAGVRSLEREIAGLCRKAAKEIVEKGAARVAVEAGNLERYLGIPKYLPEEKSYNAVGVATGLAVTEFGGQTLAIEVLAYPGKGDIQLTGKLGSVMQESARAALSYVKSVARSLGVPDSLFKSRNFHIHVPEGAIPKDGPSAGIALAAALASQVTGRPVVPQLAMTGEITLHGRVLAIGGLKEKVMAAHRAGARTVLFPEANRKDLEEIPKEIAAEMELVAVRHVDEVLARALKPRRAPRRASRSGRPWPPDQPRQAGHGYPPVPPA